MIPQFEGLTNEEANLLTDAIPLVTILIAGADGNIDQEEKDWATKLTKIRGYAHPESLHAYYQKVGDIYEERLTALINNLPNDADQRGKLISEKLTELNDIFPKLEENLAFRLYESLTTFADHVARASGGFLRFGAISKAEAKYVKLPMITPIEISPEEES